MSSIRGLGDAPASTRDHGLKVDSGGWKSTLENNKKESSEDLGGSETILYDTIMVDTCQTFVKTQRVYNTMSEP